MKIARDSHNAEKGSPRKFAYRGFFIATYAPCTSIPGIPSRSPPRLRSQSETSHALGFLRLQRPDRHAEGALTGHADQTIDEGRHPIRKRNRIERMKGTIGIPQRIRAEVMLTRGQLAGSLRPSLDTVRRRRRRALEPPCSDRERCKRSRAASVFPPVTRMRDSSLCQWSADALRTPSEVPVGHFLHGDFPLLHPRPLSRDTGLDEDLLFSRRSA